MYPLRVKLGQDWAGLADSAPSPAVRRVRSMPMFHCPTEGRRAKPTGQGRQGNEDISADRGQGRFHFSSVNSGK